MKLAARLWLLGALLPSVSTLVAILVAGHSFRQSLGQSLDRALLAQAAVESVSLFDGPGGHPHLHMSSSPLVEQVRPFAPSGALHGPDGHLVMRYPPPRSHKEASAITLLRPGTPGEPPVLTTRWESDGIRLRELTLTVASPSGGLYTLRLSASLGQIDTAVHSFYRVTLSLAGLFALVLLALQTVQARRLAGRLLALNQHMRALRAGNLDRAPPVDRSGDEIAHLRDVIAEATEKLRAARGAQERLIADAAHELRTPLTLMRTSIDLALRKDRDAAELREALAETRREVDRLALLAGNLLDLAALGRSVWDRQAGDLRDVLHDAVEGARAEAEARGLLIELCADAPAPTLFHASAMRQAIDNLLSNAIKFSPPGGVIRMALQTHGPRHRITVQDQGPGIPAAEREAVFAPFRRLARDASGAGLGLTIVREIAHRHGGRVWVAENNPRGALLIFEIS